MVKRDSFSAEHKEGADILPVLPLTPTALPHYNTARAADGPRDTSRRQLAGPTPGSNGDSTLASLLQISTKTLQTRERSSLQVSSLDKAQSERVDELITFKRV